MIKLAKGGAAVYSYRTSRDMWVVVGWLLIVDCYRGRNDLESSDLCFHVQEMVVSFFHVFVCFVS
jgi:hypothetical protein